MLDHPNIVGLHRYFYSRNEVGDEFLSLVLEYMPTSLEKLTKPMYAELRDCKALLSMQDIVFVMREFLQAIRYLHDRGISHRDIKPHNILVDMSQRSVKLCDFGCAKRLQEGEPNIQYICARYYRAPEIALGWSMYSVSVDLWSTGCVFAEMLRSGLPLFAGKNTLDQWLKITQILGPASPIEQSAMGQQASRKLPGIAGTGAAWDRTKKLASLKELLPLNTPNEAFDLLLGLLEYDPMQRIRPQAALNHPFLALDKAKDSRPIGGKLSLDRTFEHEPLLTSAQKNYK